MQRHCFPSDGSAYRFDFLCQTRASSCASRKHCTLPYNSAKGVLTLLQQEKLSKNYLVTKESGKDYTKQYANLYYMRLAKLRQRVLKQAAFKWDELESGGQKVKPKYVGRVLDVQQGELCYIVGTVYMNMRLKPDVLQEIAREVSEPLPLIFLDLKRVRSMTAQHYCPTSC